MEVNMKNKNLSFKLIENGEIDENNLIVDKEHLKSIIDSFGGDWASDDKTFITISNMQKDDYAMISVNEIVEAVMRIQNEANRKIISLNEENNKLKAKLNKAEAQINLQIKQRQISDKQVKEIKELINQGLSYKKISEITKWSTATISKIKNGVYD